MTRITEHFLFRRRGALRVVLALLVAGSLLGASAHAEKKKGGTQSGYQTAERALR